MTITSREVQYAEKCLRRLDRDARLWPLTRWILLVTAILSLGFALYIYSMLPAINDVLASILTLRRDKYDPGEVELFVKGQLTNLRLEIVMLFRIIISGMFGLVLLLYCFMNWNRHLKSTLMATALRTLLSESKL